MSTYRSSRFSMSLRRGSDATGRDAQYCNILRAIKDCNTTGLFGPELNRLPKNNLKEPEVEAYATGVLIDIRKKHDFQKLTGKDRDFQIQKRKDQLSKLKKREEELRAYMEQGQKGTQTGEAAAQSKRSQLQQAEMQVQVLINMSHGTKEDTVVLRHRLHQHETQLRKCRLLLQQERAGLKTLQESKQRALKFKAILADRVQNERDQRALDFSNKNETVRGTKVLAEEAKGREGYLGQLADKVMQEKDESEKRFQRLMLAHSFLSHLLRDKMEREMTRFRTIQDAFKTIKIATGVSETNELISKYLNKEAAYGELLFKIADNERKIELLRAEHDKLVATRKALRQEMTLVEAPARNKVNLEEASKRLRDQDEGFKRTEVIEHNMKNWLRRTARKLMLVTDETLPLDGSEAALTAILGCVAKLAKSCKADKLQPGAAQQLTGKDYQQRNVRVGKLEEPQEQQ